VSASPTAECHTLLGSVADGAFYNTGQSCCSVERIYVHESIHDAFVSAFVAEVKGFKMGDPMDEKTKVGAIVNQEQLDKIMGYVKAGQHEGAALKLGGNSSAFAKDEFSVVFVCGGVRRAEAQMQMQMSPGWQWQTNGNVFAGGNYQYRKFTDFHALESQNWVMLAGQRPWAGGELQLTSMLSFEPFTFKEIGSPQVFQTGETFEGVPLVDYQHPHDLVTNLGAWYGHGVGGYRLLLNAAAVGSPAIGPQPFMHRPSAAENPQAPLSHHYLDSTHITPGVLTAALSRGAWGLETSWFRGREPDEQRTDFDLGALDSWSVRGSWKRSAWNAQVSGGHITNPEITEPGRDVARLTASVGYHRMGDIDTALFGAWGQNREAHGNLKDNDPITWDFGDGTTGIAMPLAQM
jgi:hypothetical protein